MADIVIYNPSHPDVPGKVTEYHKSANTPDYDGESSKVVNPDLSALSSVDIMFWKEDSGSIVEMSSAEKDLIVILDEYKVAAMDKVDARSGELISAGYTFSSKQFSLSINGQINILATDVSNADMTFPFDYNTIDNLDKLVVTDATMLHNMYLTALATKKAHLDSGTTFKDSIRAAADKAAVDAVVDTR